MTRTALVVTLLAGASALADDIPSDVREKAIAATKAALDSRVANPKAEAAVKARITASTKAKINPSAKGVGVVEVNGVNVPVEFPSKEARDKYVSAAETELKKLQAAPLKPVTDPAAFAPMLLDFKVNSFGRFIGDKFKVVTVVDKESAVMVVTLPLASGSPAVAKPNFPTARALVSGVNTSGFADNSATEPPSGIFVVLGNKKIDGVTYLHIAKLELTADEAKALVKPNP